MTDSPFFLALMRVESDLEEAFQNALILLQDDFERIDPKWGEVNHLVRGDKSWPLSGAPDVLRAVYGVFDEEAGHQQATAEIVTSCLLNGHQMVFLPHTVFTILAAPPLIQPQTTITFRHSYLRLRKSDDYL